MAGVPTTPALVGAARAGSLGFLAGGYKSAEQLAEQILQVRAETAVFVVNLFVPNRCRWISRPTGLCRHHPARGRPDRLHRDGAPYRGWKN
jgi:NAD(P)H-dependent flavin oxidoreductase YrpB (nitropropane dioxygenase family)